MSDTPAPPPGFELETPGVTKRPVAAAPAAETPAPPPGFEIEKAPVETFQRGTILPFEKGDKGTTRLAMPQIGKDIIDSVMLPGRAAKGEDVTMDDISKAVGVMAPTSAGVRGAKVLTEAGATLPKAVTRALKNDGLTPEQVAPKLAELGPDGVLADLGPNLRGQAGAVATTPGPGQRTVVDTLRARQQAAPDRLRTELDTTLGAAPVPSAVDAGLKEGQKALSPEYTAALAQAKPVDTTALAAKLDETITTLRGEAQTALTKVRGMLNKAGEAPAADPASIIAAEADPAKRRALVQRHLAGEALTPTTPLETDPSVLLATRRAIGGMLDTTKDTNVQRVLTEAKQAVDGMLEASVPGIKDIDAKHGSLAQARTNLETGQTVLDSGRTAPRPSELQGQMDKANQPIGNEMGPTVQAQALSQGARAEIDRIVGTNLNDRAALNGLVKGQGDWNYDRLSTLFGKEKTDRIYKVLENERAMAETENLALSNSKTGAITAAQKDLAPEAKGPGILRSGLNIKAGDALSALYDKTIGRRLADARQSSRGDDVANAIMSNGPLKSSTASRAAPDFAMLNAIMRPDVNPAPNAVDRERLRRMQADKVY